MNLLAGHLFDKGSLDHATDYHENTVIDIDREEAQLAGWLRDIAGDAAAADFQSLQSNVKVARYHRDKESPDDQGRQPWYNILFVYRREHVLVEEVLGYPFADDLSRSPARMKRFSRMLFADCRDEVKRLFPV